MIDREKTIKTLEERIIEVNPWEDQPPLKCDISYPLLVDVLELLKELKDDKVRLDRENQKLVEQMAQQPQIVRCKDCKYKDVGIVCYYSTGGDWFCADGKRRGDSG